MSFCSEQVLLLAGSIYSGIGAPSSQSVAFVSGWIMSSGGGLAEANGRLNTSFYVTSGSCIAGCFGSTEGRILQLAYEHGYYTQRANEVLAAGGIMWTNMRDGDSSVTRVNPVDVSKGYLNLANKAEESLRIAVANWKLGVSLAVSVDSVPTAAWPSP